MAMVLAMTLADVPGLPARAAPPTPAKPTCPDERPDSVAAVVTARLCGKRVEAVDQRTETTRVWALPEGGFTTEIFAGPVRFKRGDEWRAVDLTLRAEPDGSVVPVGHPRGLRLAGASGPGEHLLASVAVGDDTLGMVWTGSLPAPVLSGTVATYRDVQPGVDLTVEATRLGFEQSFVVKDRAAAARIASMSMPLRSKGLRFVADGPGSFAIRTATGTTVGRVPTPMMWDAQVGPTGERLREKAMRVTSRPHGSARGRAAPAIGADAAAGTGSVDLEIAADPVWLNDPATVYPVRLDPQVEIDPTSDTFVRDDQRSTSGVADHSGANYLAFGKSNTYLARAFMQWPTAQFAGGQVTAATLHLWNWYAGSCAQGGWWVWNTAPYNNPIFWDTQPALLNADGYSTQTAGFSSSCNDNWITANVQPLFARAATAGAGTAYMGLTAYSETNTAASWKQVRSLQSADTGQIPYVTVTYNAAPVVSGPSSVPATTGCATGAARPFIGSATPQLRATVADADSVSSTATFEWGTVGGAQIGGTTVTNLPSGTTATATVPAGAFTDGGSYWWRVRATDGTYTSPWHTCEFTVDAVRPGAPHVSSTLYPSIATDNTWGHGGYGQAGQFVLTPGPDSADLVAFQYQLDTDPAPTTVSATAATTVSITPSEDGRRTLRVWAKDRAGSLSDPNVYVFNVGRAGLTQPRAGANVVKRTKLSVDGDSAYTRARFQYRRGPGAMEHDVPLANLVKADGSAVTYYPVRLSELGGHASWNAVDTLGATGGVVQVRALLFPDADNTTGYATQWVTIDVDPNGSGGADTDAGPGSVNLLTGDFQLSSTDTDEFGMSVNRTASSRQPTDGWIPQGERLTAAQQQVTDITGFSGGGTSTVARSTTRGQGSSTDSLEVMPTHPAGDSFAVVGSEYNLALGMKPGRRYRATAWIYVPASSGLNAAYHRSLRITGFTKVNGAYQEISSARAAFTDGWQELTVDLQVPAGATEAFFRLYNGHAANSGKPVYWDNISVREVVAPFGPQWRGGAVDGLAASGYETLTFPSPEVAKVSQVGGDYLTFGRSTSGQFFPEPGAEDLTLTKLSDTTYRLSEVDGGYSDFTAQGGVFVVSSTHSDEDASTSRYVYNTTDNRTLLTKVINPTEPGVGDCAAAVPAPGCEVLEYEYATTTTATGTDLSQLGDYVDRVTRVKLWSWNPATSTVDAVMVTAYAYDSAGRLRKVWDPRPDAPLVTYYEYDDAGRVTRITPPGELPWMFDYGTAAGDPDAGRLLRVRRTALVPGSRNQVDGEIATNVVYGVPLTRGTGGPHDMDATAVNRWGQTDVPTDATAVFPPEGPPGTNSASAGTPGPDGYGLATVHYLNANGEEVNTAEPGGHVDSQQFDEFGNEVWSLEATNRALALGTLPDANAKATELNLPADSAQRAQLLATISVFSPDGVDLVERYGPRVRVGLETALTDPTGVRPALAAGTVVLARRHEVWRYDEGKPDGVAYHLETTEQEGAAVDGYPDADVQITRTGYAAERGGTTGWRLRKPTSITVDAAPGGAALTSYVVYDSAGRTVKSLGIGATGTDPRTTLFVYYTAGANPDDAACGGKAQWAGQLCVTRAGGAVTGHDPARMSTDLPVKRTEEYSRYGDPARVVDTAAGKSRRTVRTFDNAKRVVRTELTGDEGVAFPAAVTDYDPVTGDAIRTTFGTTSVTREYDLLGRLIAYTDADGGTTRTDYDRYNKILRIVDNSGTITYTYDRTIEPRGLMTSFADSTAGTFTARWSPDGQLVEMVYPGGLTRRDTLDASFDAVSRVYTRGSDNTPVYAEAVVSNSSGKVVGHTYTGGSRVYTYDRMDRLTDVAETGADAGCVSRRYTYDGRTNRLRQQVFAPGAAGVCAQTTTTFDQAHTYDTADRVTDAGYTYDAFGRTTSTGTVSTSYYVNDLVAGQVEGSLRRSWTAYPDQRVRAATTEQLAGGTWSATGNTLYHYGDDTDEPRWIVDSGVTSRYVSGPDGDLAAISSGGSARLQLVNLHGDVVASTDLALTTLEFYRYDEFGAPAEGQADRRYGWLGGKQRAADGLGDTILMGVRLYSPQLGRFLQVDPVDGGNANAYDYCFADPVNCTDLDGKFSCGWCKKAVKGVAKAAKWTYNNAGTIAAVVGTVSLFLPPPANLIGGGIALAFSAMDAYRNYRQGNWAGVGLAAVGAIPGVGAFAKGIRAANASRRALAARKAVGKRKAGPSFGARNSSKARKKWTRQQKVKSKGKVAAQRWKTAKRWDRYTYPFAAYDAGKVACQSIKRCRKKMPKWMS